MILKLAAVLVVSINVAALNLSAASLLEPIVITLHSLPLIILLLNTFTAVAVELALTPVKVKYVAYLPVVFPLASIMGDVTLSTFTLSLLVSITTLAVSERIAVPEIALPDTVAVSATCVSQIVKSAVVAVLTVCV